MEKYILTCLRSVSGADDSVAKHVNCFFLSCTKLWIAKELGQ